MPVVGAVKGHYNPHIVEEAVKKTWDDKRIYELVKEANKRAEKEFLFIDGPPYPSGDIPHIGTAWNKSLKDAVLRFKRMQGYRVYDKPGYDCHGLPIEVKVEQRLGIRNKREIEERIGVEEFIARCKELVRHNISSMTRWFKELGVFMDWDNPYLTMRDEYIEAGWWLLKKADEMGLLDKELRVVYWCPRCSTTLAEYEIEYQDIVDPSIYVKFPVKGRDREYLLIWTTTPWTLPANTFVMAHPDAVYVRVKVGDEVYILARDRLEKVFGEIGIDKYTVIEELPGRELEGLEYTHPLKDLVPLQEELEKLHRVYMAPQVVTMTEGTGLVHGAPGHGFEDFMIAREYGVDVIASPVDEEGRFTGEAGKYAGKHVREANPEIIEDLRRLGYLLYSGKVKHRYPVCWRCKTPVILRATRQWIIRVTKLKEKLKEEASRVNWLPDWALERLYHILDNLQDWVISRQRYWGTPIPIWICPNGHRLVIGSIGELEKYGGKRPKELHKPWIDNVVLKCPVCGKPMRRIPDVMDVWFDSGISFYAARGHPEELDPNKVTTDFIVEGHDQIRGWFFSLLRAGVLGFGKAPYKTVLVHGFALDEKGREMHKSLGNYVGTDEAIAKAGRDPLRLWVLQNTVWEDLRFSWKFINEVRRDLGIAWNVFVFASTYMNLDKFDPTVHTLEKYREHLRTEDKWILSRINSLVKDVTSYMEKYLIHEAARRIRRFIVDDVSHWYIRLIRPRVWVEENVPDKMAAYATLYYVLKRWLLLSAPFIPFITELLYQEFIKPGEPGLPESIHLMNWPSVDEEFIDKALEGDMEYIKEVYEATAAARMKGGVKLRQPIKKVIVFTDDEGIIGAVERNRDLVIALANAKEIEIRRPEEVKELIKYRVEPNYRSLGPKFRKLAKKVIEYMESNGDQVARDILEKGSHSFTIDGEEVVISRDDVKIIPIYAPGYIVQERKWGSVAIDTRLSEKEIAEGFARDLVRRIQVMRKELNLPLDAKIKVYIDLPEKYAKYVDEHRDYIMYEVRAVELTIGRGEGYTREWDIDGVKVVITILQ